MPTDPPGSSVTPAAPTIDAPVPAAGETGQIARAASVLAMGNITSRALGLVRETVLSRLFGAGAIVDAYGVATLVPTMLYDLLVGGMVNGALVPIFSEYAERDRHELWRLASTLLNLTVIVLALAVLALESLAPQIAFLMLSDAPAETRLLAARLLRITVPAVFFLSLSGVLSGLLYALKRFSYPAFTAAVFNAAIVVAALAFHQQIGIAAMAVGLLVGSALQVVLQLPGLRDAFRGYHLRLWHPGLRRIALLFAPSLVPLIVDVLVSRLILYRFAVQTGEGGISWMRYATYLVQLPQGLVASAISMAILPTLSAHAAAEAASGDNAAFRGTLARGLRLVAVLILPAAVGLGILARPVVALLYEGGEFVQIDTLMTAWALRFYLLGLPFAAVDLLLVFAFYARQDTVTPSLIGVGTILASLLLAAGLLPTWGLFSLMLADSFKHLLHTMLSGAILFNRLGGLRGLKLGRALAAVMAATTAMGLAAFGVLAGVDTLFPAGGLVGKLLAVLVPGTVGAALYVWLVGVLGMDELRTLWGLVRRRLNL